MINIKIVPCTIEVVETNSQTALNNLSDEVDKMLTINKTLEKEKMIKHQAEVLREIAISSKKNIMKNSNTDGFSNKKFREYDKREYIFIWREQWAYYQNMAYERNNLPIRVSHESLEVQGIDREPTKHLNLSDWRKEQSGEHTIAGNEKRLIQKRNQERSRHADPKRQLDPEIDIFR